MRALGFFPYFKDLGYEVRSVGERDPQLLLRKEEIIIFIKPHKFRLPHKLSKLNLVIIDPLDDSHHLPSFSLPFHFLFPSNLSKVHYVEKLKLSSARTLFHHYDSRIQEYKKNTKDPQIAYVGDPIKLDISLISKLRMKCYGFEDLLSGRVTQLFHWTLKPIQYDFEPLTKTVTALASGAIPIINSTELGEILPTDYPFHLSPKQTDVDLNRLMEKLSDPMIIELAQSQIRNIDLSTLSAEKQAYQLEVYINELHSAIKPATSLLGLSRILLHDFFVNLKQLKNSIRQKIKVS